MRYLVTSLIAIFSFFVTTQSQNIVLIAYHSETGNTKMMAEAVAEGVSEVSGVKVLLKKVNEVTKDDLIKANAIVLGSPVHNANPSPEILTFIESWPFEGSPMKDKLGAVFVTGGGISAGEELVQTNLLHAMMVYGMIVIGGDDWTASFGASGITDEIPFKGKLDQLFIRKGERLGMRVGKAVKRWGN